MMLVNAYKQIITRRPDLAGYFQSLNWNHIPEDPVIDNQNMAEPQTKRTGAFANAVNNAVEGVRHSPTAARIWAGTKRLFGWFKPSRS